jgi:hypothetical protein
VVHRCHGSRLLISWRIGSVLGSRRSGRSGLRDVRGILGVVGWGIRSVLGVRRLVALSGVSEM